MNNKKRVRARAIILQDEKLVSMYREREGRVFYTFPGGGIEDNETEEECVIREVFEEFGMIVEAIKKVYTYENDISVEHFYVCKHISGEFGSGEGEEYQENRNNGVYRPTLIDICDIPGLPLMPPEVALQFYKDYKNNGVELRDDVKLLVVAKGLENGSNEKKEQKEKN